MQFYGSLLVPAGTLQSAPVSVRLPVSWGRLKRYTVYFPPGQAGKVCFQVHYRGRQILPTSIGAVYRGDDLLIDLPDDYPVFDVPFEFVLYGWSPAANYDHTVYSTFYVESRLMLLTAPYESGAVEIPDLEVL